MTSILNPVPVFPGPAFGILPRNFPHLRGALAKVRAGTGPGKLFCIGDSTTEGHQAASFGQNYPSLLVALLNSYYIPCAQTWMFPHNVSASPDCHDPRVTLNGAWAEYANAGGGGGASPNYFFQNAGASATLSFAPSSGSCGGPASVDTFDIYTTVAPGTSGSVAVNVDGGSTITTITNTGALAIKKTTITVAAGVHVLNLVGPPSSSFSVIAVNAYLSTAPVLEVANMGITASYASTAGNGGLNCWSAPSPQPWWGTQWAVNFAPDCTIIDLGINDAKQSVAAATYEAAMQTIITAGQASGDVLLKSMVPTEPSLGNEWTFEQLYLPVMAALAPANSAGFLDGLSRWVSYAFSNPYGYYNADGIHPSTFGYADVAQAVFDVLKTL